MKIDLNVIIPVYNEADIIEVVVHDWVEQLNKLKIEYRINIYNDGSTDSTKDILEDIKVNYPDVVKIINKINSGHGPTILCGYNDNLDSKWIFQVDSDNEIKARHFKFFWKKRDSYDFIIGNRINRKAPIIRKIMTYISKLTVLILFGNGIKDVNSPYRLMKTDTFKTIFKSIPENTFAPNIIIAGMALEKKLKVKQIDVIFESRESGINSLNYSIAKLMTMSIKSFAEIINYARKNKL